MGYSLQHLFPAFLHRTWYVDFLCGWGGKITKHHKKAESLPPSPVAQQIQFGNPPPLLDLINRHSLAIFFRCSVLHSIAYAYLLIMIYLFKANLLTGLINLTIPTMYTSDVWAVVILVLYSITHCGVPPFCLYGERRGNKRAVVDDGNFLYTHFIEWDCCKLSYLLLLKVCSDFGHCCA